MATIAMLLPREAMKRQAEQVIQEENMPVSRIVVVDTANIVNEARNQVLLGSDIIIARGLQAMMVKAHTKVPVIEIILTGQEQGLLVVKAKQMLQKPRPHLAFVGNIFSDMTHFEELFDIRLSTYTYQDMEEFSQQVDKAVQSGADILIGGDMVQRYAKHLHVPFLFANSTTESLRGALRSAMQMAYAMDIEKKHTAQIETVLNNFYSGMLMIDAFKRVTSINQLAEEMLDWPRHEALGHALEESTVQLDLPAVDQLLSGTSKVYYSTVQNTKGKTIAIQGTPLLSGEQVTGAIFICRDEKRAPGNGQKVIRSMYLRGYVAQKGFGEIFHRSKKIRTAIDQAKLYAMSKSPVLIYGEIGTEKELFAQGIHQASAQKSGPYMVLHCGTIPPSRQEEALFGAHESKGVLEFANFGTLYLEGVEQLTPYCQQRLLRVIQTGAIEQNDLQSMLFLNLRILAGTSADLRALVDTGSFRADLYYTLQALTLSVAPLRERVEDIRYLAELYLQELAQIYYRRLTLSSEAWDALCQYSWPGNQMQLQGFCERLLLCATQQKITGTFAQALLKNLYGEEKPAPQPQATAPSVQSAEEMVIAELLRRHHGNRGQVAKELGISTTTLWRKMKKYNL